MANSGGKEFDVLFETEHDKYSEGYTSNYIPIRIFDNKDRKGKILSVKIINASDDYCIGEE